MFQYTKATLKAHLALWIEGNGTDADPDFTGALDEIIQRAETRLERDLDIGRLNSAATTTTAASTATIALPTDLIAEEVVLAVVAGKRRALHKRSRAFVESMNQDQTTGVPQYYADYSETQWFAAPIPDAIYSVIVHGAFRPGSIVDGADDGTTWLSTRVPDVLALACDIEAASFLKNYTRKADAEQEYTAKLDDARALTENQRRVNVGDIVANRESMRQPTTAPNPAATT